MLYDIGGSGTYLDHKLQEFSSQARTYGFGEAQFLLFLHMKHVSTDHGELDILAI